MTFLHFEAPKFCIWISFYNFHTNLHTPTFLENNKKKVGVRSLTCNTSKVEGHVKLRDVD